MRAAYHHPTIAYYATTGENHMRTQDAQAIIDELDALRELLRRHVMDWGGCVNPRIEPCDCSDAAARRYLANLGIPTGEPRCKLE